MDAVRGALLCTRLNKSRTTMRINFACTAILFLPLAQTTAQTQMRRLIVLNKAEATASLIDPTTRKEVTLVPVGEGPHECAVSPDGRTAVVCNYGDQQPGSTLTVIDVAFSKALRTITLSSKVHSDDGVPKEMLWLRPHGIAFVDATHIVVTSEVARRLLVVDIAAGKVERALPTPQGLLHMVALAEDRKHAFGTSIRDGSLATFALDGASPPHTLPTGKGAEGVAVAPGSGEVWVTNREADTVSICAADGRMVTHVLDTGEFPIRVAFTPGGTYALVSCAAAGIVQVWRTKDRTLAHTIDLLGEKTERSPMPIGICIEPEGKFAWVACNRGEWLAVIDLTEWRILDRIPARKGPDGMAFAIIAPPTVPR